MTLNQQNPQSAESRKRPLLVNFRVTSEERATLHRQAATAGLSVGNLIRVALGLEQAKVGRPCR